MEPMHRVSAMASGGLGSLPHDGAVITVLLVCGLTHHASCKDIGAASGVIPAVGVAALLALGALMPGS